MSLLVVKSLISKHWQVGHTNVQVPQPRHASESSFHTGRLNSSFRFSGLKRDTSRFAYGSLAVISADCFFIASTAVSSAFSAKPSASASTSSPFSLSARIYRYSSSSQHVASPFGSAASIPKTLQKQLCSGLPHASVNIIPASRLAL